MLPTPCPAFLPRAPGTVRPLLKLDCPHCPPPRPLKRTQVLKPPLGGDLCALPGGWVLRVVFRRALLGLREACVPMTVLWLPL